MTVAQAGDEPDLPGTTGWPLCLWRPDQVADDGRIGLQLMTGGCAVREFVYISEAKLGQFRAEPSRFARKGILRLTSPVGSLDLEPPANDAERDRDLRLKQVDKHLEERAEWFADPNVQPGDWVWFEAPLQYVTLPGAFQHIVLFADPAPGQHAEYEQEANCRLLMHGSMRHLIGYAPATADGTALEGMHDGGASFGIKFLTSAGQAVSALSTQHDPVAEGVPAPPVQLTGSAVHDLIEIVDQTYGPMGAAAWMSGFARVTIVLPASDTTARCVVASPLTVESAHRQ
ncbi:SAVMC3_10250 family protein [Streptomyces sp. NBC_00118]|uniref:SAVMC3_10250 family protein n=1 Tax=Streptomyces sp. NBC_00118 TaxID=2975658 RepID=UPI003086171E|nr:SAVMC3_10250 family protein [Streptomyces sp. NBC_01397]